MIRMIKILAVLALISAAMVLPASAHPFTDETIPPQFSSAPVGTSEVVVSYSESVEISFSELRVFDSIGEQVDNGDTSYFEGDNSLVVTTGPLQEGVYTVTSKVLSRVDGHLVDYAFVFGVGDVQIDRSAVEGATPTDLIFFPEAGARFPGLVGQTVVLGAAIASLFVWGTQRKDLIGEELGRFEKAFHGKFMTLVGAGLVAVFASNILMLTVQTLRLEASAFDALQTSFGMTWSIRMGITVALLGVWFAMERAGRLSPRGQAPLLVLALLLIATTTMMGHGTASGQPSAMALDYVHNLVSSAWIGGIIFLAFALLPALRGLGDRAREGLSLAAMPRFSIMFIIAIGIVIITGPVLMWLLEDDLGMIAGSTYGRLIVIKILLASAMIGIGWYHQFSIQKKAEKAIKSGAPDVNRKLGRSLRAEVILGVALLGVVALLTNGTLPEGEVQTAEAQEVAYGLSTREFSGDARFDVEIYPFAPGVNTITVLATGTAGDPIADLDTVKVKVGNPSRNIVPVIIPMEAAGESSVFQGEATFGFSGDWQVEVEAKRTESANEGVTMDLLVKPRLENLRAEIVEYELPEAGAPLYPLYDGAGNIWISDSSGPQLWRFSIADEEFTKYEFEGESSITLEADRGRVWFTDVPAGRIGYVDMQTGESEIVELPPLEPADAGSFPIAIDADADGNLWISIANKNVLLRYDPETGEFDVHELPTENSGPFAVAVDDSGRVWFSQQTVGQIGYIDPESGEITEIAPPEPLSTPETITIGADGTLWIAEHQEGGGITRYDPVLGTFEKISAPDPAAFPNSAVFDRYRNVWFALHTVDKIAAYDPQRGGVIEVPVPTAQSWAQFTTSDDKKNVWFVEQKPSKLATIKLTEVPAPAAAPQQEDVRGARYTEVASPLIALGIIAVSLFFVKGVKDKRRINGLVYGE
ncbi:streptogramin lyase [Cenarchaeum symbiosum A]|uniref:Streptogramin lyase n=1 Tax=Cenarchaeum symbiosum (strain A) TaxID=414004 RepID=A0RYJ1_CENSY|nr:streptogramin lyase [Cenarchaeum symbiosum A]